MEFEGDADGDADGEADGDAVRCVDGGDGVGMMFAVLLMKYS